MSNTVYIKLKNGAYKKVVYKEKESLGMLHLAKDELPVGENGRDGNDGYNGRDGRDGYNGKDGRDGRDAKTFIGGSQFKFITNETHIEAGSQQISWDLWVMDKLVVDGSNETMKFGETTINNDALLIVKKDLNIEGTLQVEGLIVLE
jgi:hypothetical protein